MRYTTACAVAALGTACASGRGSTPAEVLGSGAVGAPVTTRVNGGANAGIAEFRTVAEPVPSVELALPADAARVYAVLPAAYERLGLAANVALSDARTYGVRDVRAPRRVARVPLSRYLDCGTDPASSQHADTWTVTLTALSRVAPTGDSSSTLVTQVVASAVPATTSGAGRGCTSTGALERAVSGAVLAELAR